MSDIFAKKNWQYRLGFLIFMILVYAIPLTIYARSRPVKDDGFTKYEVSQEAMMRCVLQYCDDEARAR